MHATHPRPIRKRAPRLALTAMALLAAALPAAARQVPTPVQGGDVLGGEITSQEDQDEFAIWLFAGDVLSVTQKTVAPVNELVSHLGLLAPDGTALAPLVKGQDTKKPKFTHTAAVTGAHVVTVRGQPGTSFESNGNYQLGFKVKRVPAAPGTFSESAGGTIAHSFNATRGAKVDMTVSTKKGAFELTALRRPDGAEEAGFTAALKVASNGRKATLKKFPLTGSDGAFVLEGTYDAGSSVKVSVKVAHDEGKDGRPLGEEPDIDTFIFPVPSEGIAGTEMSVSGVNLVVIQPDDEGGAPILPEFFLDGIAVPPATVEHAGGQVYFFPVPAGVVVGTTYDLFVRNTDGQMAVYEDAITIIPAPSASGFSPSEAGPAGGRLITISGTNFHDSISVSFGGIPANTIIEASDTRIRVRAPKHAPGGVTITLRDEFGQTATPPGTFTYLDIGSNEIKSTAPVKANGFGGQTITVTGEDFGADSVFTMDDRDVSAVRDSATQWTFVMPPHPAGTMTLRVVDQYEQSSALSVTVTGLSDQTASFIPVPNTGGTTADGWRASRVLLGNLNPSADSRKDLVLLRPFAAFGNSATRSRVRLLRQKSDRTFEDRTAEDFPAVVGDEDWRARDGALADFDGDNDLDLAITTDEVLSDGSGGTRSSLRIFINDGNGVFSAGGSVPAVTNWKDSNQAVALMAANVDGDGDVDLVLAHNDPAYFTETIMVLINEPDEMAVPPIPPIYETTVNDYPSLRVLLNDGTGAFTTDVDAVPAVSGSASHQYQGDALAMGDVDGDSDVDIVMTRDVPPGEDGTFDRAMFVLANSGGTFTDASAARLPAKSDPEYLQGDRVVLADADADSDLDIFLVSNTRLVSPVSGAQSSVSALRLLTNASGSFSLAGSGTFPANDFDDYNQGIGLAVGDITGDGAADVYLIATRSPNTGDYASRVLVKSGSSWKRSNLALPNPGSVDDGHGADVVLTDHDGDGDLDVFFVRDDPNENFRNTRYLRNDR